MRTQQTAARDIRNATSFFDFSVFTWSLTSRCGGEDESNLVFTAIRGRRRYENFVSKRKQHDNHRTCVLVDSSRARKPPSSVACSSSLGYSLSLARFRLRKWYRSRCLHQKADGSIADWPRASRHRKIDLIVNNARSYEFQSANSCLLEFPYNRTKK